MNNKYLNDRKTTPMLRQTSVVIVARMLLYGSDTFSCIHVITSDELLEMRTLFFHI
jgi:hypothetical protein